MNLIIMIRKSLSILDNCVASRLETCEFDPSSLDSFIITNVINMCIFKHT